LKLEVQGVHRCFKIFLFCQNPSLKISGVFFLLRKTPNLGGSFFSAYLYGEDCDILGKTASVWRIEKRGAL